MTSSVLIARLLVFYDPFDALFGAKKLPVRDAYDKTPPQTAPWDCGIWSLPSRRWHVGRVRFFRDEFRAGRGCEPIEMDNACEGGNIYGPIVIDGHHRLCGAMLAGIDRIPASYTGRVDTLRYLTGKRKRAPDDLA